MKQHNIAIPVADDFSFQESLWFLNRNFDDCMHTTGADYIRKALLIAGQPVLFEIREGKNELIIEILKGDRGEAVRHGIVQFVSDWLEPQKNLLPFYELLQNAPQLSYMATRYTGLSMVGIPDLFEALIWSIIGQQINLTFAYKLKRRLVEKYGSCIRYENGDHYIFPGCVALAKVSVQDLREMQFSEKKASYVIGLANVFTLGEMSKDKLEALPTLAEKQKALTAIRGIGIWTANYALMKSLREPSSIPHGDAGLLNALLRHQIIEQETDADRISSLFANFRGWENYLVFYLWRSLAPTLAEKNGPLPNSFNG